MTFSGEAYEWFQSAVERFVLPPKGTRWTPQTPGLFLRITPVEGEAFDGFIVGIDPEADMGDTLVVQRGDENAVPQGEPFSLRVQSVHVY